MPCTARSLRPEETELLPETLDRVMYMSYANDVAMQVNGRWWCS